MHATRMRTSRRPAVAFGLLAGMLAFVPLARSADNACEALAVATRRLADAEDESRRLAALSDDARAALADLRANDPKSSDAIAAAEDELQRLDARMRQAQVEAEGARTSRADAAAAFGALVKSVSDSVTEAEQELDALRPPESAALAESCLKTVARRRADLERADETFTLNRGCISGASADAVEARLDAALAGLDEVDCKAPAPVESTPVRPVPVQPAPRPSPIEPRVEPPVVESNPQPSPPRRESDRTLASGEGVVVPRVTGLALRDAVQTLRDRGLTVTAESVGAASNGNDTWRVMRQDPLAGGRVASGSPVRVGYLQPGTTGGGPAEVTVVPSGLGMRYWEAVELLVQAGFDPLPKPGDFADTIDQEWIVDSQSPPPGASADGERLVELTYRLAPARSRQASQPAPSPGASVQAQER